MKRHAYLFLTIGMLMAANAPAAEETKKELEKFQGNWKIVSVIRMDEAESKPKNSVATVAGNKFTTKADGKIIRQGTMKLDASKKPFTIDSTYTVGPDKGKTLHGIYEFDGDTWKIYYGAPSEGRPKAFPKKKAIPAYYLKLVLIKRDKD